MTDDKERMPADGSGTEMTKTDSIGEVSSRRDADMAGGLPNTGESGGGPYPNPHTGHEGRGFGGGQVDLGDLGESDGDSAPENED